MKWLLLGILFVGAVLAQESSEEDGSVLSLAGPCDLEECQLPNCRCSTTEIPGGLAPRDTPQFVTITFDDGINILNIETYRDILYNRVNKNGCRAGATFYVSHEWTNYQLVNELYNQGFEIALHSISHVTNSTYWSQATYEDMVQEFADQRRLTAHFGNIPLEAMKGVRIPFLQMTGNVSFQVMADYGLTYDCSWPTVTHINPGLWPYTLHHASTQDCLIAPPCPTASIPGPWVLPMVTWRDLQGDVCSFVDGCLGVPDQEDEEAWYRFFVTNFERHYLNNRAPFGFYIHEAYISVRPAVMRAMSRFMDLLNNLNDVFMVNSSEVIEWVQNPVPVNEYRNRPCPTFIPTVCPAAQCNNLQSDHNIWSTYNLAICNVCPARYPWVGNPFGL